MPRPTPRTIFKPLMLILLLALLSLSCRAHDDRPGSGSSGLIKDPAIDLTGSWTGTWATTSGFPLDSGTVDMLIAQDDGGGVTGSSDWTWTGGEDCWLASPMKSGILDKNVLTGLSIVNLLQNRPTTGLGPVVVKAEFTVVSDVTGDELIGTFRVATFRDSAARCSPAITRADNTGVISLRRS